MDDRRQQLIVEIEATLLRFNQALKELQPDLQEPSAHVSDAHWFGVQGPDWRTFDEEHLERMLTELQQGTQGFIEQMRFLQG